SHATLFTGLPPTAAGATAESHRLPEAALTLAERLVAAGYRTFGASCNSWVSVERGFAQGFEVFEEPWRLRGHGEPEEEAVRQVTGWIEEAAAGEAPAFFVVNLNGPHLPYDPPRELARRFVDPGWPGRRLGALSRIAGPWAHFTGALVLTPDDFAMLSQLYATEIHHADLQVGELLAALERAGTRDETLVVVTSDHGENLGDHGRIGHALSMYDTTLRVPLIVRYPPAFAAGTVVGELVSLLDVAPTVLSLTGAVAPGEAEETARRSLAGPRRGGRRFVVAENGRPLAALELLAESFPAFDARGIDHPMLALRTDRHKLVWKGEAGVELYDLAADPAELDDLSAAQPRVRDELLRGLELWREAVRSAEPAELYRSEDEEAREWLRTLGYIQ
ncbi:MAG: sulfatase-like hydrolase/transferase, partial [Thermoanaerobaculia bacterium]|nr:sulfatase-like hydrolase/transferase [Thermoanaerobaculia bacterium]